MYLHLSDSHYMRVSKKYAQSRPVSGHAFLQGFSIIEVLLVVIILSVVAGLAIPNFSRSYHQFHLKNAADELAYVMRYAQSRAVTKNRQVRLEFDPEFSSYWITEGVDSVLESDDTQGFQKISGRFGKVFRIPDDLSIEGEASAVTFYPDGRIDRQRFSLCNEKRCFMVSTKEQRGHVRIFQVTIDE